MKHLLLIVLGTALLTGCNSAQQNADNQKPISWEEKTIAEILKYEAFTEKNLDLSMEKLIAKKEACLKYANATYGEGFAILGSGAREYNEHRYSPRFDRCFTKREYSDDGGLGMDPISTTTIIDVISERTLFNYNPNCENIFDRTRYTDEEYQDRCPYESDMRHLWDALIEKPNM